MEGHCLDKVRLGVWQGCLLSPLLFNLVIQVMAPAIRQGNEIKGAAV